jgi:hypothetical protein
MSAIDRGSDVARDRGESPLKRGEGPFADLGRERRFELIDDDDRRTYERFSGTRESQHQHPPVGVTGLTRDEAHIFEFDR